MAEGSSVEAGSPPIASPRRFALELTVVVAIAAGLIEALLQLLVVRRGFHRPIYGDGRLLWTNPVGYLTLMLPFGLAAAVLAGLGKKRTPEPTAQVSAAGAPPAARMSRAQFIAVAVLIFWPALLGVFVLQPNLYPTALAVMALGVAFVAARRLAGAGPGLERTIRRLAPTAVAVVAMIGLGQRIGSALVESRTSRALPSAPPNAPNVLLLVWDTVREMNVSLYGYPRPTTPNLERLAERSITFTQAFSIAPWTLPSHGAMFSGLLEQEMVVGHLTPFETDQPLLSEILGRHGYLTGGFVGNTVYAGSEYGLTRGFLHYEDYRRTLGTVLFSPTAARRLGIEWRVRQRIGVPLAFNKKTATQVNADFLRWLDGLEPGGRPFFGFLNYFDAHRPHLAPPPFDTLFGADPARRMPPRARRQEVLDRLIAGYDASIAYLDDETGRLLEALRSRGLLDNTIVIVTADHGEHFGEHDLYNHSNSLYQELLQVPLVIRVPSRQDRVTIAEPVSLRDLPATIVELVGVPGPNPFPGRSLLRPRDPEDADNGSRVIAGDTPIGGGYGNAVITNGRYFIVWPGREPALYRFPEDSVQGENLAERPEFRSERDRFMATSDSLDKVRQRVRAGR
jgi:arylsulfatase A-like enzyme